MPSRKYAGKVLIVTLSDVAYANDYASYMYDQKLAAYVECHGVVQRLMFYIVGSDRELNNAVLYCYNNYNTKFRKVAKTRSVNWKDVIGSINEDFCDHVLTPCTLGEFYNEVMEKCGSVEVDIPNAKKCQLNHAVVYPVTEDTTIGGRFHPIVPYGVEKNGDEKKTMNNQTLCVFVNVNN